MIPPSGQRPSRPPDNPSTSGSDHHDDLTPRIGARPFLAAACSHGYTSGGEVGEHGDAPKMFALAEQLVVKRAREIYAQDGA